MSWLKDVSVIVPYYRQPEMLSIQLRTWRESPAEYIYIVVDDGSPEPAEDVIRQEGSALRSRIMLYRADVDIPWNRGGARNLGSMQATTEWIIHIDIDHVIRPESMGPLLRYYPQRGRWYRFPRWRKGKADATRRKDKIPPEAEYGKIHPHVDSYLIERESYWTAGGYDERYSGVLYGGTPFIKKLASLYGEAVLLPDGIDLLVYTRDVVRDSSDWSLPRDPNRATRRRAAVKANTIAPTPPVNFRWHKVELL